MLQTPIARRAASMLIAALTAATAGRASVASSTDPAVVGQWSAVQNWPIVAVHAHVLPTGDVLAWSDYSDTQGAQVWRPSTNTFTPVGFGGVNLFCAGHAFLADGRILVSGGIVGSQDDLGPRESTLFDPQTRTWSQGPLMSMGRYYPTNTTLADGRVLVQGGTTVCNGCIADVPEIYDPATNTWTPMADSARRAFKYYPHVYVLPDGRILAAGQDDSAVVTQALDLTTQTWTTIDPRIIDGHSSVMFLPGKIMKAGKATADDPGHPAVATTYVLDMTQPSPAWQATASMAFPRSYLNLTVLPDGRVLATGGGTTTDKADWSKAVYEAELWSPATKTWTTMSASQTPRLYHSTAVLLPDARVLVAGGGRQGCTHPCPVPASGDESNAEIFSPPYLFKGARPVVSSAPAVVSYGSAFSVSSPDASRIASVALIALSSVTHAFNENQRFVPLTFAQAVGSLTVNPPVDGNTAPPGPYMLFLVDSAGIPSVAAMVQLRASGNDTQAPTAPANLAANVVGNRADLAWAASSDNVGVSGYDVHRSTTSGFSPQTSNRIAQTAGTSYSDPALSSGTYYYVVRARDAAGNLSVPSNQASAAIVVDTTPPGAPPSLGIAHAGAGQIALEWGAASDNVGVTEYRVERCAGSGCTGFSQVGTSATTSFDNLGLTAGTTYRYRVRAADARGNLGGYSSEVSAATAAVSDGLVAAWGLNEGAGATAADVSGYANNGVVAGAAWTAGGKLGGLSFDGTSDAVNVADSASLDLTAAMTMEAWVKPAAASTDWAAIVDKNTDRYYLMASTTSGGRPGVGGTFGSGNTNLYGPQSLAPGAWSHLAATSDGTRVRLYVNGTEVGSVALASSLTTSTGTLQIGADVYGEHFQGTLDEIRVYNRALGPLEILADMNKPVESGVVRFAVQRDLATGSTVLSWTNVASTGSYRVRRATGPSPAAFASAACWVVQATTFTDPAPAGDGSSYAYLVNEGNACP